MNARSQIHMMETIIVLAVFFILIILFFAFYYNIIAVDADEEKGRIRQLESVKAIQEAASLDEMQCSERGIVKDNCIDLLKVEAAYEAMQREENKEFYFDKFGFSRITIRQIYPETRAIKVIYDNSLEDYSYKDASNIPVSLFDPVKNEYYFGAITLETFQK